MARVKAFEVNLALQEFCDQEYDPDEAEWGPNHTGRDFTFYAEANEYHDPTDEATVHWDGEKLTMKVGDKEFVFKA
jgi:hypothetical protein